MKKILIVSPYFAPENSVASIRFTKIAKYLTKMGHDVTVLCTQMNVQWVEDKTLGNDVNGLKKVVRIRYPELLYYKVKERLGTEGKQVQAKKENAKKNGNNKSGSDSLVWGYAHFCSMLLGWRFIKYIKRKNQKYDVVITTYNPISGHMLGNYMKKNKLCTTWIEDFRDPLTLLCDKSWASFLIQFHGARLMKRSDYITAVSKGCKDKLIDEARAFRIDIRNKVKVISNGFDSVDREALKEFEPEQNKLSFTYCGTIYKIEGEIKNDISPVFEALSNIIRQGKIDKNFIEVRYAGYDTDTFLGFAQKYGVSELVHLCGRISRMESLQLQRESDIIIVPVWNNKGETGIISGKFFETLLVQRNVLCVVTGNQPGGELASIIDKLQCGFSYEEINGDKSNMEKLEEWILCKYNEKKKEGVLEYCANGEEQRYSHQYLAKKFERLF